MSQVTLIKLERQKLLAATSAFANIHHITQETLLACLRCYLKLKMRVESQTSGDRHTEKDVNESHALL